MFPRVRIANQWTRLLGKEMNVLSWRFLKSSIKNGVTSIHVLSWSVRAKDLLSKSFCSIEESGSTPSEACLASPLLGIGSFP